MKQTAQTILDYGCGKGWQYSKWNIQEDWGGIVPTLYDPGVETLSKKPDGKFNGVVCVDVLEHLDENSVDYVLSDIFNYATKFVFLTVALYKEKKKSLPNGRNFHSTVKPINWWKTKISKHKEVEVCEVVFRKSGGDKGNIIRL